MNTTKTPAKKITFSMQPELHARAFARAVKSPDGNFSRYLSRLVQQDMDGVSISAEQMEKITAEVWRLLKSNNRPRKVS